MHINTKSITERFRRSSSSNRLSGLDESNHAPNLGRRHSSGDIPVISPTYFKDTMHETILPSINENDGDTDSHHVLVPRRRSVDDVPLANMAVTRRHKSLARRLSSGFLKKLKPSKSVDENDTNASTPERKSKSLPRRLKHSLSFTFGYSDSEDETDFLSTMLEEEEELTSPATSSGRSITQRRAECYWNSYLRSTSSTWKNFNTDRVYCY